MVFGHALCHKGGTHFQIAGGGPGVILVQHQFKALVQHVFTAGIGDVVDGLAAGGNIDFAVFKIHKEEGPRPVRPGAKAHFHIKILGKGAGIPPAGIFGEQDGPVQPGGFPGIPGGVFQFQHLLERKQAHLVKHTLVVGGGRQGQPHRHQQGAKEVKEFFHHSSSPPISKRIRKDAMPTPRVTRLSLRLSMGASPQTLPVWPLTV